MEETKRRVRKATLIIVGILIVLRLLPFGSAIRLPTLTRATHMFTREHYPVLIAALCANYGGEQLSFTHYV